MPRKVQPRLTADELKARGSTLASTRKAEAKRAAELKALTPKRGVAKREEAARAPLPATEEEWVDLVKSLPGYDPARLAGGCLFDPALASKAIDWIETNVRHMKGPKALSAFHLERWQRAFVANLFGWVRPDGTRRFREALLYVGKKNGKSLLVAALALYLFLEDGESGAEVYCAAAKRDQAKIVWNDCVTQLKRIDPSEERATRYQHSVTAPDGGFLKPISADAGTEDGMNPHAAMVDELHRQQDDTLLNVIRLSTAARAQPLVIMLTTADEDRPDSVCNETLERAKAVRDNPGDPLKPGYDAEFLPAIYEASPRDDWKMPETWRKANPNLGVSLQEEFLAKRCREAQENPSLLPDFLRYHLNVQTRASGLKLIADMGMWDACRESFDVETLRGRACIAGLDLASTTDITAFVLVFPETLHVLPYFWVPEEAAKKRDLRNDRIYTTWGRGAPTYLNLTEGNQIDEQRVLREIVDICRPFKMTEIAVDPANAVRYTQAMTSLGFKVVHVRQGWQTLNEPLRHFSTLVGNSAIPGRPRIRQNGNPVMRWMVANAEYEQSKHDTWNLVKPRGAAKIDGVAALVTALSRVILAPAAKPKGVGSFVIR